MKVAGQLDPFQITAFLVSQKTPPNSLVPQEVQLISAVDWYQVTSSPLLTVSICRLWVMWRLLMLSDTCPWGTWCWTLPDIRLIGNGERDSSQNRRVLDCWYFSSEEFNLGFRYSWRAKLNFWDIFHNYPIWLRFRWECKHTDYLNFSI